MVMIRNKRGFFLTVIALFFLILLVFYQETSHLFAQRQAQRAELSQSIQINNFIEDLNYNYLPATLELASADALNMYLVWIKVDQPTLVEDNVSMVFLSLMMNKTTSPIDAGAQNGFTLSDRLGDIILLVNETYNANLHVNLTPPYLLVKQTDPWKLDVEAFFVYNVSVQSNKWINQTVHVKTQLSIVEFGDPLYAYHQSELGNYMQIINRSNVTILNWNQTLLHEHVARGFYVQQQLGPSYLMRMVNNLSASNTTLGIVSFVNLSAVGGNQNDDYSYVDFQYITQPWNCVSDQLYSIEEIETDSNLQGFRIPLKFAQLYLNNTKDPVSSSSEFDTVKKVVCS